YLYPCADGPACPERLYDDGGGRGGVPDLENENGRLGGQSHCPGGRQFLLNCAADRRHLGQADLGHLVGMGCAFNLHAVAAVFVLWRYRPAESHGFGRKWL